MQFSYSNVIIIVVPKCLCFFVKEVLCMCLDGKIIKAVLLYRLYDSKITLYSNWRAFFGFPKNSHACKFKSQGCVSARKIKSFMTEREPKMNSEISIYWIFTSSYK